jgi:hypothetical protein
LVSELAGRAEINLIAMQTVLLGELTETKATIETLRTGAINTPTPKR